jgi:hypothetical protein
MEILVVHNFLVSSPRTLEWQKRAVATNVFLVAYDFEIECSSDKITSSSIYREEGNIQATFG